MPFTAQEYVYIAPYEQTDFGTLPVAKDVKIENNILCSCINFLKSISIPVSGDAWNLKPNSQTPEVGSVALFHYPNRLGHAALVIAVYDDFFMVEEANFRSCAYGYRKVDRFDRSLIGFIKL